jgi:hypothetical protein
VDCNVDSLLSGTQGFTFNSSGRDQALALSEIAAEYVLSKQDVDSAIACCARSSELDPAAGWQAGASASKRR